MSRKEYESYSEEDTFDIAFELSKTVSKGTIITLNGDLGTGKTVFTKGFGAGLGIDDVINSPTFTIMKIYESGRMPLYHFDVYRIEDIGEMDEIGYEDYFFGEGVCLVEWAENIPELIPKDAIKVSIEKDPEFGFEFRRIVVESVNELIK
ncbi:MAG: tRNA (adenosine(37)-N6)-threonylcarbamoyltransferase complex ATPase subunit type 1 TsaE [Lachnospiraceae bacterium]|nr:tRNA (adenosine(37)-N6)-threonylcarbamoyltransferase complex ATPase subunit type 1 TsaE [Lachnospiraceae bacterium]